MEIVVDCGESRSGLPQLLADRWSEVEVRRLTTGDVRIGEEVLVERKTTADFAASLSDGRLFRQASPMVNCTGRPVVVHEGIAAEVADHMDPNAFQGAVLTLAIGYRIPVLRSADVIKTADLIRHIAAQVSKRSARRFRRDRRRRDQYGGSNNNVSSAADPCREEHDSHGQPTIAPETIEVLLAVPHVGPSRARAVAEEFQSIGTLANLGLRELMRVPGIGPDTAAHIYNTPLYNTLHGKSERK